MRLHFATFKLGELSWRMSVSLLHAMRRKGKVVEMALKVDAEKA